MNIPNLCQRQTPQNGRFVLLVSFALLLAACGEQSQTTGGAATGGGQEAQTGPRSCILAVGWTEREPFHYRGPDGSPYGTDIEIITRLAESARCALRYRQIDRASGTQQLADGKIDVLLGSRAPGDNEPGVASQAYRQEHYLLHVPRGRTPAQEDLTMLVQTGFTLGVINGIEYNAAIRELRDNPLYRDQFSESPTSEAAVDRLLRGEIDGILDDTVAIKAVAKRKLLDQRIDTLFIAAGDGEVVLRFSPDKAQSGLVERFNQAIDQARQNGEIKKITERFG